MTIHKLAAGSGYEYLTRQVAAGDSTELGSTALADYYEAEGEAPGQWVGAGLAAFAGDGIGSGDVVTAGQMGHLFGAGEHPVAGRPLGRRTRSDGVAGFDLTFSPVKSVSALWAVAPPEIARAIEQAHDAAVHDALAYVEHDVLFTREGTDGVRQVETRGLIAAAFRHRDSRAGDPDLHTHVAVANKVQAKHSGRWLTVYGRVLFQHTVAISETYNTALEYRLGEALGVTFTERANPRERRPVREAVGVSARLCRLWSRRARDIDRRENDLVTAFVVEHGRPPTEPERLRMVQQANLETRAPKHEPRAEADQRRLWRRQASEFLGSESTLDAMIRTALDVSRSDRGPRSGGPMEAHLIRAMAVAVITELETRRATWQSWHLRAEAERQVRMAGSGRVAADDLPALVDDVVVAAVGMSVPLTPDDDPVLLRADLREPGGLRRSDGTSVYRHTGADHYTSQRILQAEQLLVDAAGLGSDFAFSPEEIDIVLAASTVAGVRLNDGQRALVHALAGGHRVRLALAPAGSGKTTAVEVLAAVWTANGYDAIGLAPSAAAAKVLQDATGLPCETLAKIDDEILTHNHAGRDHRNGLSTRIGPETLVVIDEAGMADTLTLDRVVTFCLSRGAMIRLLGDDQQLSAVGAGGVLRDIAHRHGADRLEEVVRFIDPGEAAASLDLRDGDRAAIGFYLDHDRVHTGDEDTTMAEVLAAWQHDREHGLDALMLAPTRDMVATLNQLARTQRLGGVDPRTQVELADGNQASVGDTIITRHNQRRLAVSGTDWVKNGDRWTITRVRRGTLTVRHATTGLTAVLPADYVADHVELGYASTVHTAQGLTTDVVHGIVDGREDRQMLYTMLTRGRLENHVHVVLEPVDPVDADREQCTLPGLEEQLTAIQVLDEVVARDGAAVSATTTLRRGRSWSTQLHDASVRYGDAVTTGAQRVLGSGWEEAIEAAGVGPLPWLPSVPAGLARDESWGPYLAARARHVEVTADGFLNHAHGADAPTAMKNGKRPAWIARYADVLGDLHDTVALWRAAHDVPEDDPRPTGPAVNDPIAARFQRHLLRQLTVRHSDSVRRWHELIIHRTGTPAQDDHTRGEAIELARMLDTLHRRGHDASGLLDRALASRALPESHAIAALTYRIRKLTPHDPLQSRRESAGHASPSAFGL
ncbi:MobF family relaxase [Nocardioides sp. NPDC057772]|uniref:MobF family relaxase n=1 Tax=Nocardioides sp. NPDC057772 TaxID=3346245 RepID=UPI00366C4646